MSEIKNMFLEQKKFFDSFNTRDVNFRIVQLKKLKANILKYETELLEALKSDLGKSETQTYLSEIGPCMTEINYAIKNLKKWSKDKKVKSSFMFPLSKSYIKSEPLGVVLIISPWNYPFNLAISPLVGAISAGNCSIVKPSEISKNTSKVITKIIEDTFEKNYINAIEGGAEITQELLDEKFDYIFYTGGETVGKIIMEKASKNLTPVTLELGGKSPCIIDKNCNLEKTANRVAFGKFINAGQTCIAPDYILIDNKIKEKFIEELIKVIEKFYLKDTSKSNDYGRIINKKHFLRLNEHIKNSNVVYGGDVNESDLFISPTLVDNINGTNNIMEEEIFGPILPIIEYEKKEEIIEFINSKAKPLALYIFSNDKEFQNEILDKTSSGGVCINDTIIHIGNNKLPFGGVGNSGMGAYHGKYSFDTFSHKKSVLKNTFLFELPMRYPPYSQKNLNFIKKLFK